MKGADSNVLLGPWPQGVDNIHPPGHRVFQPPSKDHLPRLTAAMDMDVDDQGWLRTRRSTLISRAMSNVIGAWNCSNHRAFVQQGAALYDANDFMAPLAFGFRQRVALCEHWGGIFVTDGYKHIKISDAVRNWGLPVPALALTAVSGSLPIGRYLAQAAFVDAMGNEGGASDLSAVIGTGLRIAVDTISQAVVAVNLYISKADQPQTSFVATVPVGALPWTLIDPSRLGVGDPPKTAQMTGPISNANGLCSYRGFLLMWRDNAIFRSEAGEPHLFHADNILQFPAPITSCEGTAGGLWVGTEQGLWWVSGEDSVNWIPIQKTHEPVAQGSHRIQAAHFPSLNISNQRLSLFVAANGLIAGTEDGSIIPLTVDRYRFESAARYAFAYTEHDDLRQLLILGAPHA